MSEPADQVREGKEDPEFEAGLAGGEKGEGGKARTLA